MDTTFVRQLIAQPGEDSMAALLNSSPPGVFLIDWREADDNIVNMVAQSLGGAGIDFSRQSQQLQISYAGRSAIATLESRQGDQDRTLDALNRVLRPDFEIRLAKASNGNDTLAFQVLSVNVWQALETEFGAAVEAAFQRLDLASPLFCEPMPTLSAEEQKAQEAAMRRSLFRSCIGYQLVRREPSGQEGAAQQPVRRAFCGELDVGYIMYYSNATEPLTQRSFALCEYTMDLLDEHALQYSQGFWSDFLSRRYEDYACIQSTSRLTAASFALHPSYWHDRHRQGGDLLVAVPNQDVLIWAYANKANGVVAVLEAARCMNPSVPGALSSQVFQWNGQDWQVHSTRDNEPSIRRTTMWQKAERGEIRALFELAWFYQTLHSHEEAARHYTRAAELALAAPVSSDNMYENGSAAMCNLADKYEHGLGVPQDFAQALHWYSQAAGLNNCVAQYSLGNLYLKGLGVERNVTSAVNWFSRSAAQGYDDASKALELIPKGASD